MLLWFFSWVFQNNPQSVVFLINKHFKNAKLSLTPISGRIWIGNVHGDQVYPPPPLLKCMDSLLMSYKTENCLSKIYIMGELYLRIKRICDVLLYTVRIYLSFHIKLCLRYYILVITFAHRFLWIPKLIRRTQCRSFSKRI